MLTLWWYTLDLGSDTHLTWLCWNQHTTCCCVEDANLHTLLVSLEWISLARWKSHPLLRSIACLSSFRKKASLPRTVSTPPQASNPPQRYMVYSPLFHLFKRFCEGKTTTHIGIRGERTAQARPRAQLRVLMHTENVVQLHTNGHICWCLCFSADTWHAERVSEGFSLVRWLQTQQPNVYQTRANYIQTGLCLLPNGRESMQAGLNAEIHSHKIKLNHSAP